MRFLTGGHAIWMGGWTTQVHHHQDFADTSNRSSDVLAVYARVAMDCDGLALLPPEFALADSLLHADHRIMPVDEIDPDYMDDDQGPAVLGALLLIGAGSDKAAMLLAPYRDALAGTPRPGLS